VLPFGTCTGSTIGGLVKAFKPCDVLNCTDPPYFDPCLILQCSRPGHMHVYSDNGDEAGSDSSETSSSDSDSSGTTHNHGS